MTLESSVALLDPEHRGMYLVGGVKYAEVRLERTPLNAVWTQRRQDATDAVIQCHPTGLNPTMPADKLVELLVRTERQTCAASVHQLQPSDTLWRGMVLRRQHAATWRC